MGRCWIQVHEYALVTLYVAGTCRPPAHVTLKTALSRGHQKPINRWESMKSSESEVTQSCLTLCNPMDCSLPGSSVHGIFQARILEWVAISFSRGSSRPRDQARVSHIVGRRFTVWVTREAHEAKGWAKKNHTAIGLGHTSGFMWLQKLYSFPCIVHGPHFANGVYEYFPNFKVSRNQLENLLKISSTFTPQILIHQVQGEVWTLIDTHTLLHMKKITKKDLPHSTGNSAQYSVRAYVGKESLKQWIYVYA